METPAIKAFVASVVSECLIAQVLVRLLPSGFELRHVKDRALPIENLRLIPTNHIRVLTQFTANSAFRPLKSAPNLQRGWRFITTQNEELEFALNQFYPGAIADWFALNFTKAPPTDYRDFTNRQSGMYRITAMLTDAQAAPMIRACCHKKFCWKQRLWTVDGLETDSLAEKSLIPCLEPCAILLEFARKAVRLEQAAASGEKIPVKENDASISEIREADFENPQNPRRLQLAVEKKTSHAPASFS